MSEQETTADLSKAEVEEMYDELMADDRRTFELMTSLKEHAGWRWMVDSFKKQLDLRRNEYELRSDGGMDAMIDREFLRGEIAAIRLLLTFPDSMIDHARAGLEGRQQQMDEELDNG